MAKAVSLDFDANYGKAISETDKLVKRLEKTEQQAKGAAKQAAQLGRKLEDSGRQGKAGFDTLHGGASRLMGLFGGALSAGGAIAMFSRALSTIREESEQAARALSDVYESSKRLAQVSTTRPGFELANLTAELAAVGEGIDPSRARELMFQARSFGLGDQFRDIAQSTRFGDPGKFMGAVGKFRAEAAYGPGVGSARQLISAFLAAGAPSDIEADVIAQAAVKALQQTKMIGTRPAELLGLMSVLSPGFASPEETATGIRSLATVIDRAGFGGKGLLGGLAAYRAAKPEEAAAKIGAEVRAKGTAEAIASAGPLLTGRIADIETALSTGGEFERMLAITRAPRLTEPQRLRALQIGKQIGRQQRGYEELKYQGTVEAFDTLSEEAGDPAAVRIVTKWVAAAIAKFQSPEAAAEYLARVIGGTEPKRHPGARFPEREVTVGAALTPAQLRAGAEEVVLQRLEKQIERQTQLQEEYLPQLERGPELAPAESVGNASPEHLE